MLIVVSACEYAENHLLNVMTTNETVYTKIKDYITTTAQTRYGIETIRDMT